MNRTLAEFRAPWSRPLRVTAIVSAGVLLGAVLIGSLTGPRHLLGWWLVMVGIPLTVLTASLPFMVRGYGLTEQSIEVRRLGWTTTLPLLGLVSVTGDSEALRNAWRFNGGLFGITGWFWNRRLGRFRAFATDPSRAVLLRYSNRKVVVTPHDTQHFIVRVRTLARLRNSGAGF
jgi:hypothetical protein